MKKPGQVHAQEIIDLCKTITDNEYIANHLNCSIEMVREFRKILDGKNFVGGKRPYQFSLADHEKENKTDEEFVDVTGKKERDDAEQGSQKLLIRQMESGQHWLNKEQFVKIATDLKLQSRLPKGAKNNEKPTKRLPSISLREKYQTNNY